MPRVREEGASGGFGKVAGAGRLTAAAWFRQERRASLGAAQYSGEGSGAGLGELRRRSGLARPAPMKAPSPASILRGAGQRNVSSGARAHVADCKAAYQRPPAPSLQADPQALPHPRRQVEGGREGLPLRGLCRSNGDRPEGRPHQRHAGGVTAERGDAEAGGGRSDAAAEGVGVGCPTGEQH